jgi:hypothetical protein
MKLFETIKNSETVDRLASESSPYFKPFVKIGGGLAVIGLVLKVAALCFPATMPIGLVSLAPEFISIGLTMFTGASLTKKQK